MFELDLVVVLTLASEESHCSFHRVLFTKDHHLGRGTLAPHAVPFSRNGIIKELTGPFTMAISVSIGGSEVLKYRLVSQILLSGGSK